jgi:hypothetical protein
VAYRNLGRLDGGFRETLFKDDLDSEWCERSRELHVTVYEQLGMPLSRVTELKHFLLGLRSCLEGSLLPVDAHSQFTYLNDLMQHVHSST